jgi:hypothetical protein
MHYIKFRTFVSKVIKINIMSCKGLTGDALKKCQEKNKSRPNQQDDSNKYVKGSAKVSLADLNEITFKNAQAQKLIQLAKDKERAANQPDTTNKPTKAKLLQFGGNRLGGSRMKLHRKKNNRST